MTITIPVVTKLPLTTIFTAPEWCSDSFYTFISRSTTIEGPSYFFRALAEDGGFDTKYNACYPSNFQTFNDILTSTPRGRAIYSPGVCPAGWNSYVSPGSYSTNAVTSYVCCPLGFQWANNQACKSAPSTSTIVALNASKNITMQPPYFVLDWPLNMAWGTTDLDKFTPASAPLVLTQVTGKPSSETQPSDGLSTGVKAGIGAGVALLVLALIALIACLLIMRRRRAERRAEESRREMESREAYRQYEYPSQTHTPLPGYESPRNMGVAYAKYADDPKSPGLASPVSEMSGENRISQLDTPPMSTELDATKRNRPLSAAELDNTQVVHEAYGTPIERYSISNDQLGALGLAPIARTGRGGYAAGAVRRGPSNTSSFYSDGEGTMQRPPVLPHLDETSGTLQGRWSDDPSYGYGRAM